MILLLVVRAKADELAQALLERVRLCDTVADLREAHL